MITNKFDGNLWKWLLEHVISKLVPTATAASNGDVLTADGDGGYAWAPGGGSGDYLPLSGGSLDPGAALVIPASEDIHGSLQMMGSDFVLHGEGACSVVRDYQDENAHVSTIVEIQGQQDIDSGCLAVISRSVEADIPDVGTVFTEHRIEVYANAEQDGLRIEFHSNDGTSDARIGAIYVDDSGGMTIEARDGFTFNNSNGSAPLMNTGLDTAPAGAVLTADGNGGYAWHIPTP